MTEQIIDPAETEHVPRPTLAERIANAKDRAGIPTSSSDCEDERMRNDRDNPAATPKQPSRTHTY